jgi:alpha-L-arabinofuranosidase
MRLVADEWGGIPADSPIDIVDEHYYNSPAFFIQQATRYDSYDRTGHKVYVGEYAVTQNCGNGNLRAALGEAAFMTGMERNSDVVIMASYAPLFANLNFKRWNPDLINFDNSRVYGTPSYYVQKMFAENRADVVLPALVEVAPMPEEANRGGTGPDRKQIHDVTDSRAPRPLHVVAGRSEPSGDVILKTVNVSNLDYDTDIRFHGVNQVRAPARATVLTSPDPADENTLDQPMKVAPVEQVIHDAATAFRHTFPAHSVTVLRVKTE